MEAKFYKKYEKISFYFLLVVLGSSLMYTSCSSDEKMELTSSNDNLITGFKRITINELSQIYEIKSMKTSDVNFQKHLDGLVYTVDLKNKNVVVTKENEEGSISCNMIRVGNSINYKLSIAELKPGNNSSKIPRWMCAAQCGLEAAVIAASDGPSPIMDAIAIAYAIACGREC